MITKEILRSKLDYNENTGIFTRTATTGIGDRYKKGEVAGGKHQASGYIYVSINGKPFLAHRMAWLYMYGHMPSGELIHINGDRTDNRIKNLKIKEKVLGFKLTQATLKELFHYDKETGVFERKKTISAFCSQIKTVGSYDKFGYLTIRIDGKSYKAHRLVFLYVYGYLPENDIDHINRVKDDNRLCNLREVSRICNSRNIDVRRNNSTGINGVYRIRKNGKFSAQITINKKMVNLGSFTCIVEAACHRLAAEQCVQWHDCGNSSAKKFITELNNQ